MVFKKPDDATIERLTIPKLETLIVSLKERRAAAMAPQTEEIKFYENLLLKRVGDANAKTSS